MPAASDAPAAPSRKALRVPPCGARVFAPAARSPTMAAFMFGVMAFSFGAGGTAVPRLRWPRKMRARSFQRAGHILTAGKRPGNAGKSPHAAMLSRMDAVRSQHTGELAPAGRVLYGSVG